MTSIEMMVLAGILMLITAFNMKLIIWYIVRKQAKRALQNYPNKNSSEEVVQLPVSFSVSEIKCIDSIKKNIDAHIDALKSKELEKIGIMKDDKLVAVIVPIERYEALLKSVSQNSN